MSGLTLLAVAAASVPTPSAGKVTVFFNLTTGFPSYKDDAGVVHLLEGPTGSAGATGRIGPPGIIEEADYEPILIPGRRGSTGAAGAAGATGQRGLGPMVVYVEEAEDGMMGPPGKKGTGTGGGTILYDHWDPLVPDDTPHADTEEFDTNDLSAFTIVNSRGTVDADTGATHKLWMNLPSQQYRIVAALKAVPADATLTMHTIVEAGTHPAGGLLSHGGLILSSTNTTNTGSQRMFGLGREAGANERIVVDWINFGETAAGAATPVRHTHGGTRTSVSLFLSGGVWLVGWSGDGETWYYATITPGFAVNFWGVYAQNYSGVDCQFSFEFSRYYAADHKRTGKAVNILG